MPRFGDTLLLRTIPESIYRFIGSRRFWVLNQEGEELVSADSSWLYINMQSRRPLRVSEDMKRVYGQRIRTRAEVREGEGGLQCLHAIIGDDGQEKSALRTFWNNV